jgi:hypothetical protein
MIIGVMSDTHGNRKLMHQVADLMAAKHGVEMIIHVGDDYADAEELAAAGHAVRMVPGLYCDEYHDGRVPNRIVVQCDDITISAAHVEKDLRASELAATVVLTGHTHIARIAKAGRSIHLNPGHLKNPKLDRGERPSFAIVDTEGDSVTVTVFELTGEPRMQQRFLKAELA